MAESEGLVQYSNYADYHRELTDTVCKLIKLTRPITVQHQNQRARAGKEPNWRIRDQLSKVQEECLEIIEADAKNDEKQFNEENLDLLFASLTEIHVSNLTEQDVKFAIAACLAKFHKRGWLKF